MRRIPLRNVIIALMLILLGCSFYVFSKVGIDTFNLVVEDSSRTLFREVNRNVESRIRSTMQRAPVVASQLTELYQVRQSEFTDNDKIREQLALRLSSEPYMAEMAFFRADTNCLIVVSRVRNSLECRELTATSDGQSITKNFVRISPTQWKFQGQKQRQYDPKTRPWYKTAVKAQGPTWTPFYQWVGGPMGVSCVVPVRRGKELIGIFTVDFNVGRMSDFFDSLVLAKTGRVFLLDADSKLLVSSKTFEANIGKARDEVLKQLKDKSSIVSKARSSAKFHKLNFQGAAYLIDVQQFAIDQQLTLQTLIVVPDKEVFGLVYQATSNSAIMAVTVTVLLLAVAIFMAGFVIAPLQRISQDLNRISRFDFTIDDNNDPDAASLIYEIDAVRQSYDSMTKSLRSFEKYVPKQLVQQLIVDGKVAEVGGDKKVLTLHFSDLAGFTGLSEGCEAEEIVVWLSEYLTDMTNVLQSHGGTIDKFMGDGILGFFNAPVDLEDHALHACRAALAAQEFLAKQRETRREKGQTPVLHTRIGLHTGEVIVGNIGTPTRFAYTVIGDAVNLASRLEGLNKSYGTEILVSEETYRLTETQFAWRKLDKVAVVGRQEGVVVYELLGDIKNETAKLKQQNLRLYEQALELFFEAKFDSALSKIQDSIENCPEDKASQVLKSRIENLIENPPGDDWDGVFRATAK